jgi:hypothetical protein
MAKDGKMVIWVIVIAVAGLLAYNAGMFDRTPVVPEGGIGGPDTQLQAVTLLTKDALAPTDTSANVSYYVFDKAGKYVASGTSSAGVATFNLNWGQDYDVIAFSASTFYPEQKAISTKNAGGMVTETMSFMPVSNATVNYVRNPDDMTTNISVGLGLPVSFDLRYSVTLASSALYKPVIVVDVNQTSVQDVNLGGLSKVACPTRITTEAGRRNICFQDSTLKTTDAPRQLSGSILFSSSVTPSTEDTMTVKVIDTQMYLNPNWAVVGKSAFLEGTENPNDLSNVGASDSATATLGFAA